jgi:hypothetical protein
LRVLHTPVTLGAEGLGDLHGERAHAARRAGDQDRLPWLHSGNFAQRL